jgi:putative Holliday junction resolvase
VRVLGVDFGRSRTGLALSDPVGVTCHPFDILVERDEERLVAKIVGVAQDEEVGEIVVGLPRPLSGGTNRQMEDVLLFVERLKEATALPVVTWDERFTSKLAEEGRPAKRAHDAVAACYLLQSYLESCRNETVGDV